MKNHFISSYPSWYKLFYLDVELAKSTINKLNQTGPVAFSVVVFLRIKHFLPVFIHSYLKTRDDAPFCKMCKPCNENFTVKHNVLEYFPNISGWFHRDDSRRETLALVYLFSLNSIYVSNNFLLSNHFICFLWYPYLLQIIYYFSD
jgi:hypothetical protein